MAEQGGWEGYPSKIVILFSWDSWHRHRCRRKQGPKGGWGQVPWPVVLSWNEIVTLKSSKPQARGPTWQLTKGSIFQKTKCPKIQVHIIWITFSFPRRKGNSV
jgi:hypothetical protein